MARKPGSDERQKDFFGAPVAPPREPKRPARPRPAAGAPPHDEQAAPFGEEEPDGLDVQLARLSPSELRNLVALLPDEALAPLVLAAIRQLRRRLERQARHGGKSRASVLERAAQQLIAELAQPGEDDF